MKLSVLRQLYMISKYCAYGLLIQCIVGISLLASKEANAQKKSIEEININIAKRHKKLVDIFDQISENTDFEFALNSKRIDLEKKVELDTYSGSLGTILREISGKAELGFRRVNDNIFIRKMSKKDLSNRVIEMADVDISGKVTDENGQGLPGSSVVIRGTTNGTTTDLEGNYKLTVPEDAVLLVSFVGYLNQEVSIVGRTTVDVQMELDATQLEEIVVIGYGTQKKTNLTGSVATVSAKDIDARPITSVATALQGTTSGVFINQNSGQPGRDNVLIRIRGVGTLNDANPLILIDGIEGPLNNINPADIQSISVLKDAASSAIYGSRAANGVVLVTTKRGSGGSKPVFTYDAYTGTTEATRLPELVTNAVQFAELRNEAHTNFGQDPFYNSTHLSNFASEPRINTDWLDLVFNSGSMQQHTLGVGGGTGDTNFRFSLGYLDQEAVVPNSGFKRFNSRFNLDTKVNDKVKIGTSIAYTRGDRSSPEENFGTLGVITHTIQAFPVYPAFDDQGRYASNNAEWANSSRDNPLPEFDAFNFNQITTDLLGNVYLEYKPIEGLTIKATGAINSRQQKTKNFNSSASKFDWKTGEERVLNSTRSASNAHWQSFNYTLWLTAQYEKTFGDNNISALVGYNEEESNSESFNAFRNGHLSNSVQTLSTGLSSSSTNSGGASSWGLRSYFGRLNYSLKDKYLFEANVRMDGSSRFSNDKWGVFPSVSAGWVISREDFLQNAAAIDFLKLRASYGQLGNQNIGNFAFSRSLSLSQAYNFGGTVVSGVAQTSLGNADLTWETATMTDIGVDLGIFDNITLEADYFVRRTKNILFDVPISALTGFSSKISNASTVENKGWELGLTFDQSFGDANFSVGGNVTHVTNEVVTLNPNLASGVVDRLISGKRVTEAGSPLNALFGLQQIGIFQSQAEVDAAPDHSTLGTAFGPGDLRFADQNGDNMINADDRVVIGKQNPTWTYGLNLRADFKGIDFAIIFQGAADFESYGSEELSDPFFNNSGLPVQWVDRWTPENTDATYPRLYYSNGPSNQMANSFYVYDRSYFRLKNIQIGYSLPSSVLDKIGFSRARFYVNGSNLFTLTDFPYFDPERPAGADRGATGFPNIKTMTVGVSLAF